MRFGGLEFTDIDSCPWRRVRCLLGRPRWRGRLGATPQGYRGADNDESGPRHDALIFDCPKLRSPFKFGKARGRWQPSAVILLALRAALERMRAADGSFSFVPSGEPRRRV